MTTLFKIFLIYTVYYTLYHGTTYMIKLYTYHTFSLIIFVVSWARIVVLIFLKLNECAHIQLVANNYL